LVALGTGTSLFATYKKIEEDFKAFRPQKGAASSPPTRLRAFFSSNAILIVMPETAEEISQQPEVRKELQRATGEKRHEKVKAHGRDKLWFVTHALIVAGCAVLYLLLGSKLIPLPHSTIDIAGRVLRCAALIVIVLAVR